MKVHSNNVSEKLEVSLFDMIGKTYSNVETQYNQFTVVAKTYFMVLTVLIIQENYFIVFIFLHSLFYSAT